MGKHGIFSFKHVSIALRRQLDSIARAVVGAMLLASCFSSIGPFSFFSLSLIFRVSPSFHLCVRYHLLKCLFAFSCAFFSRQILFSSLMTKPHAFSACLIISSPGLSSLLSFFFSSRKSHLSSFCL